MQKDLSKYITKFRKLRVDRSHGVAPHKPILLISVLQACSNGLVSDKRIFITPELVALFRANWNLLVDTNHDCRISYPFYYMKSEGFWKLIPKRGFDDIDSIGSLMKSFSKLNAAVECAVVDDDLFALMKNKETNGILIEFLLAEYFPRNKDKFQESDQIQKSIFSEIESKILYEPSSEYKKEIEDLIEQKNEEEIYLRGSLFKREIPKLYNNMCCISEMRIDSTLNVSMVDACHIVPFSLSYDDTITNGIALCPNLHRAFDRGLIAIDDDYKVLVSTKFVEQDSLYGIRDFDRKRIRLPNSSNQHPSKENFSWHRNNIFQP